MAESGVISFKHPRRGFDFCVHAETARNGEDYSVNGVLDTIGRPRRGRVRKVIQDLEKRISSLIAKEDFSNLDELDALFVEEITRLNAYTREVGQKEACVFGFCFVFAVRAGKNLRLHWMGDCRAYHMRVLQNSARGDCTVKALTTDNNKLTKRMLSWEEDEKRGGLEMFKNEILELSRQLEFYLGIPSDDHFREILELQSSALKLEGGDALLIATDGILMPIIQYAVDNNGCKLSLQLLYLEEWLSNYINAGEYLRKLRGLDVWQALGKDMKKACLKYTRNKDRYRDDMAVMFIT